MKIVSTVRVLTVESEERKRKDGTAYIARKATCILLNDDGTPANVGAIRSRLLPAEFWDKLTPGDYRAVFGLHVPDWGDDKGDLVPVVTELTPVQLRKPAGSVASAGASA